MSESSYDFAESSGNASAKIAVSAVGCFLAVVLIVPLAIQNGWILSVCWRWFMVPLGVPSIGVAHAIGLSSLFSLFRGSLSSKSDAGWLTVVLTALAGPWMVFGVCYVAHTFM